MLLFRRYCFVIVGFGVAVGGSGVGVVAVVDFAFGNVVINVMFVVGVVCCCCCVGVIVVFRGGVVVVCYRWLCYRSYWFALCCLLLSLNLCLCVFTSVFVCCCNYLLCVC